MTEVVTLEFDENDDPVIKVEGVKGSGCLSLTRILEKRLGTVTKDETTSEFKEREVSHGSAIRNRS